MSFYRASMNSIKEIIESYSKDKQSDQKIAKSERHELVSKFAQRINGKRIEDGLKPINNAFFNKKMSEAGLLSNFDLYWFYAYCDETKNFDKTWWWSLKAK